MAFCDSEIYLVGIIEIVYQKSLTQVQMINRLCRHFRNVISQRLTNSLTVKQIFCIKIKILATRPNTRAHVTRCLYQMPPKMVSAIK